MDLSVSIYYVKGPIAASLISLEQILKGFARKRDEVLKVAFKTDWDLV